MEPITESQRNEFATALAPVLERTLARLALADATLRPRVDVIPSIVYDLSILGWLSRIGTEGEPIVISINKLLDQPRWTADIVDLKSQPLAEASWSAEVQRAMSLDARTARRQVEQFLVDSMVSMEVSLRTPGAG